MIEDKERQRINGFTIDDLRSRALKSNHCEVLENQPVRYAPLEVIAAAETFLDRWGDARSVASYVYSSYEFYRGCVCWGKSQVGVPLSKKDKTLEWLGPADFSWLRQDLVIQSAKRVGRGLEDFGLDRQIPFIVDKMDNLYFMDMPTWQADSNALLLRPLRGIINGDFQNGCEARNNLKAILATLSVPFNDLLVKKYHLSL